MFIIFKINSSIRFLTKTPLGSKIIKKSSNKNPKRLIFITISNKIKKNYIFTITLQTEEKQTNQKKKQYLGGKRKKHNNKNQ
jgi:hypothetical protein